MTDRRAQITRYNHEHRPKIVDQSVNVLVIRLEDGDMHCIAVEADDIDMDDRSN